MVVLASQRCLGKLAAGIRYRATARTFFYSAIAASKPKVLLLDEIKLAKDELARLGEVATIVPSSARDRQEFVQQVSKGGEYSDVVAIYRHFGGARSIKVTGRFDSELVASLPATLRYIVHNGAGYDQLDIDALSRHNIQASNVPTAVDDATSDVALYLLLGALRRFPLAQHQLDQGVFNSQFPVLSARDPRGKTLGIVGAGGIGRALAHKASHALGMRIIYHNRNRLDPSLEQQSANNGMEYVTSLDELLQRSDIVSLHCPLNESTKGLMGMPQFKLMKRDSVLINTARGPIVKEADLVEALETDVVAGAGLDVFESEPTIHAGLLKLRHSKVELLPHVGTLTLETQTEMEAVCLRNLIHGLETGKLAFTVPEQKSIVFK